MTSFIACNLNLIRISKPQGIGSTRTSFLEEMHSTKILREMQPRTKFSEEMMKMKKN